MGIASSLGSQCIVMFGIMGLGYLLVKLGMLSTSTTRELGALLLNVVLPIVIVRSFWGAYTPESMRALVPACALSAVALGVSMGIARTCYHQKGVLEFSAAFSNAGFIGIPLVQSAFGPDSVFYIAGFIAGLNVIQWTYGRWRISGSTNSISTRSILLSPMLIALVLGIALFLLQVPVPSIAQALMNNIASLNSPLAMLILGTYLANSDIGAVLTSKEAYAVSIVRLVLVPLATLFVFAALPCNQEVKLAILIAASAPVGANVSVFCQQLGFDTRRPSETVCLSTLLSLITLPLITALASSLL